MDTTEAANFSHFVGPDSGDEDIALDGFVAYVFTHAAGEKEGLHYHRQNHVIILRSGRMRWTVGGDVKEITPGHIVVSKAGVAHGYEVLGDEPAHVVCMVIPPPPPDEPGKFEVEQG